MSRRFGENEPTYSVSQINAAVRSTIQQGFLPIWVQAEIRSIKYHRKGHVYITLTDGQADVSAVMWRSVAQKLNTRFTKGNEVLLRGQPDFYAKSGTFQIQISNMELAGEGALRAALEALKKKLEREGLFSDERKQPLPFFPSWIALITSPSGDVWRDVLTRVRRRYPMVRLSLHAAAVQGDKAPAEIMRQLAQLNERSLQPDVVLIARGGGSFEDLNCFNDEELARAVVRSQIPVVSAIGHQPDVTVIDYVADVSAQTPSTAAEVLTPHAEDVIHTFKTYLQQLQSFVTRDLASRDLQVKGHLARLPKAEELVASRSFQLKSVVDRLISDKRHRLERMEDRIHNLGKRLISPQKLLVQKSTEVTRRQQSLLQAMTRKLDTYRRDQVTAFDSLRKASPSRNIEAYDKRGVQLRRRLGRSFAVSHERRTSNLKALQQTLNAVSPIATIQNRGFAVLSKPDGSKWGQPIRSIEEVDKGDIATAYVQDGKINLTVEQTTLAENSKEETSA